jgi:large subunit ribosomal protein L5
MNNLKELYTKSLKPKFFTDFSYKNIHQVPKITKIVITYGLGIKGAQNKAYFQKSIEDIRSITGQHPVITKAKKSIAGFKVREGMPIGLLVTLRKEKMYSFLERLIKLALPRTRDFRGVNRNSIDKHGNFTLGIPDQLVFPELQDDMLDQKCGFNVTIVTNCKDPKETYYLLNNFGLPFF